MLNRRTFIQSGIITSGSLALSDLTNAEEQPDHGSGVDGYNYHLPTFQKGFRLLFQGDSITDMKWGRNQKDRNHYLGHSYVYLIAARLGVDLPEAQLNIYNRGMSGNTVSDLRNRWQRDAIEMKPDLLSILIGTNDVGRGVTLKNYETDYRYILDTSMEANPNLQIVLLEPFVLQSGKLRSQDVWNTRRKATDNLRSILPQLAKDYNALHIQTQSIFDAAAEKVSPEHWIWDGIHPLPQGHELIARHWIQEVTTHWPQI